jgi:hypothetical protein
MARGFRKVQGGVDTVAGDDPTSDNGGGVDSGNGIGGSDGNAETVNPEAYDAGGTGIDGEQPQRKRRGGPRGPRKQKTKAVPLNVNAFESILLSVHDLAADLLRARSLRLEEREAKDLANAVAAVAEHYGVGAMGPWANLGMVAAGIYGRRIGAMYFGREVAVNTTPQVTAMPSLADMFGGLQPNGAQ